MPVEVLTGKVALVTGGASGIGFAIAQRLAAAGASVIVSSRDMGRGAAAESALREAGANVLFVRADMEIEDEVHALIDAAVKRFDRLDILVNNAGPAGDAFGLSLPHDLSTTLLEKTLRVGLYGPFWCCKYALPHMLLSGGAIVNVSATAALRAQPLIGAYAMAKAALDALTRQIANDYAGDGIRCNTLTVGTVRPAHDDISTLPAGFDHSALDVSIARTTMLGRVGSYAEVADAALFLASPASRYITGAQLPVEGGALAKLQYPDYRDAFE